MKQIYLVARATKSRKVHPTDIVGYAQSLTDAQLEVERLNRLYIAEFKTFTMYPVSELFTKQAYELVRTSAVL